MTKYLIIILFLVLIAGTGFWLLFHSNTSNPNNFNQNVPTYHDLTVTSTKLTTPQASPLPTQTSRSGLYQAVTINFSRDLNTQEKAGLQVTVLPSVETEKKWLDNKTLVVTPTEPLLASTAYKEIISFGSQTTSIGFTTTDVQSVPIEDQVKIQSQADKNFGDWQLQVITNYPWYKQLPLQTESYFVYFDLDTKTLFAKIYSNPSDESRIIIIKNEVSSRLTALGVDLTTFPIEWKVVNP